MDETSVRQMLQEIQNELTEVEKRREALLTAHRGLEGWLRLHGLGAGSSAIVYTKPPPRFENKPHGRVSVRGAVQAVVRDARGQPLHAAEILKRVEALGATTKAKNPVTIIDLQLYSLKKDGVPVEKTNPLTWRWTEK